MDTGPERAETVGRRRTCTRPRSSLTLPTCKQKNDSGLGANRVAAELSPGRVQDADHQRVGIDADHAEIVRLAHREEGARSQGLIERTRPAGPRRQRAGNELME